ncbi:MAG: flavodoxin-dependent (E)-4-hydroxy-3-methylbut-2-enyl-diphosphate synthase [Oscillospiraceae bacterium]|nr:flavodoxin-dependent (E)-4-hydroxy-3-methylbut-2-enyl-diphosphate synthase [Oscillospiraceae bacterium]
MFSKKIVKVGNVAMGGKNKILVQSMLNKPSEDIAANVAQAKELEENGCEIIRISVPNNESVKTVFALKQALRIPVVADIHFDYRMAIESIYAGADKIRINPGNIEDKNQLKQIVDLCIEKNVPIRVGLNSGCIPKHILAKKGPTAEALVDATLECILTLNSFDFDNIVVSLKSSSVLQTIEAYTSISSKTDYPLHLGVTEAGTAETGIVKSSIGIGHLLLNGIGDTIRVALTGEPIEEVKTGINILKALNLKTGLDIISCPTCGRTKTNLIDITNRIKDKLMKTSVRDKDIKIAVMGCAVNGPGEARNVDFGIACGKHEGLIFKRGKIIKKVPEEELVMEFINIVLQETQ